MCGILAVMLKQLEPQFSKTFRLGISKMVAGFCDQETTESNKIGKSKVIFLIRRNSKILKGCSGLLKEKDLNPGEMISHHWRIQTYRFFLYAFLIFFNYLFIF